jgi:hypothetical protein
MRRLFRQLEEEQRPEEVCVGEEPERTIQLTASEIWRMIYLDQYSTNLRCLCLCRCNFIDDTLNVLRVFGDAVFEFPHATQYVCSEVGGIGKASPNFGAIASHGDGSGILNRVDKPFNAGDVFED